MVCVNTLFMPSACQPGSPLRKGPASTEDVFSPWTMVSCWGVPRESIGPVELHDAGLYEPDAADAAERLALLQFVLELGATLDDLAEPDLGSLPELAASIALWGGRER